MSALVWIDHSEKQRRQVLEAIDQFREKDTRDELGIASIRDAISDALFPRTGALQTRARYFLFVPCWRLACRPCRRGRRWRAPRWPSHMVGPLDSGAFCVIAGQEMLKYWG